MRTWILAIGLAIAPVAAAQRVGVTVALATVPFQRGDASLGGDGMAALAGAVAWAHDHPRRVLVVVGYGDDAANVEQARERTDNVAAALVVLGVDPRQVIAGRPGGDDDGLPPHAVVRGTLEDVR